MAVLLGSILPRIRLLREVATRNVGSRRAVFAVGTRPLQGNNKKNEKEAYEKVTEAAKALQDAAKEKRKTSESVRQAVATTASTVTKMSKELSDKVCKTADHVSGKAKDTIWETVKATASSVTDKITKDYYMFET